MSFTKNIYFILFLAGVLAFSGFFVWRDFSYVKNTDNEPTESAAGPTAASVEEKIIQGETRGETEDLKDKMPSLSRPAVVSAELDEATRQRALKEIEEISGMLKDNYNYLQAWLQLGLLRKLIGDYEGAKQAWEFAALLRPNEYLPYNNLGVLYWQHFKDYPEAEKSFLTALEKQPDSLMVFQNLHELYRFSYKEKSHLADDILLRGIEANPKSVELLVLLGGYYRDTGDKQKAKEYFAKALALDPSNISAQEGLNSLFELKELN
jgi:tetratricopeptide (TPR) repeat protein